MDNLDTPESILIEWKELFQHRSWKRVEEDIKERISSLQKSADNKAKTASTLDSTISIALELRAKSELVRLLGMFDNYKQKIAALAK